MYITPPIDSRIALMRQRLNCDITVTRCWQSDGDRPVMYCNFRGTISDSPSFRLEIGGTLCCELTPGLDDLLDLFIFLNGRRLTRAVDGSDYLVGRGNSPLEWDYDDDGYWNFTELNDSTFSGPIDPTLQIQPDATD